MRVDEVGRQGGEERRERRGREGERKKGNRDSRVQFSPEQMNRRETMQRGTKMCLR